MLCVGVDGEANFSAGISKGTDHSLGLTDRDHWVFLAMEYPRGHIFQLFRIGCRSAATDWDEGCKSLGILNRQSPGAEATAAESGEVNPRWIDRKQDQRLLTKIDALELELLVSHSLR